MSDRGRVWGPVAVVLVALPLAFALVRACLPAIGNAPAEAPGTLGQAEGLAPESGFRGLAPGSPQSCAPCHAEAVAAWSTSAHARAEGLLSEELTARLPFQVDVDSISGTKALEPVRTIGIAPVVQFLVPFPDGRLQVSPVAWDPGTDDWFNVFDDERRPGDWGHFTGGGMNWNSQCAACHNTDVVKGYDFAQGAYTTTVGSMGVGCAACHGPLEGHAAGQPATREAAGLDTCAACHARRAELTGAFVPGEQFLDHFAPQLVDLSNAYWPDGQILEEDFEYTSFISSAKHQAGITCTACHDPHGAGLRAPAALLCAGCHTGVPTAHDGHAGVPDDQRPSCVACHMPVTTYMQRDDRHDHGFSIPDPALAGPLGLPTACDRCHTSPKPLATTDGPRKARVRALAAGRTGDPSAVAGLLTVLSDPVPAWRAAAAAMLAVHVDMPAVRDALTARTEDAEALVRFAAIGALGTAPGPHDALEKGLADPVRAVRVQAARALGPAVAVGSQAHRDYLAYLDHNSDTPQALLERGTLSLALGESVSALKDLQRAVDLDPRSPPARDTLSVALAAAGMHQQAAQHLRVATELDPEDAELQFRLGLALGGAGELEAARGALTRAVELDPANARALYNLGIVASQLGEPAQAIDALRKAVALAPLDDDVSYALASILWHSGDKSQATTVARRLLKRNPTHPGATALIQAQ